MLRLIRDVKLASIVQLKVRFKSTMKDLDIGLVAQLAGISPSALRFYEKKGLIRPIGRVGLRRQYSPDVLNKLQLIALGRSAGFTLDDIAVMFDADGKGKVNIDRERLLIKAREIDKTIRKLSLIRNGLKHIANCTTSEHMQCPEFQKILAKAQFLSRFEV